MQGSLPLTVQFTSAPGTFRQPEALARVDALANWLRDEYGAHTVGLASTIRAEASNVSGVDSVPPNPDDVARLLQETAKFDNGAYMAALVNDDSSKTTLRGQLASRSNEQVATLMNRFLTIANAELAGTGITAEIVIRVPDTAKATELLGNQLLLDAGLTVAVALALFLLAIVITDRRHSMEWQGTEDDDESLDDLVSRKEEALASRREDRGWQFPTAKPAAGGAD